VSGTLTRITGSAKRIIYSSTSESRPILRTMVQILSENGPAIEVDLPRQFYWSMLPFSSAFSQVLQQPHSKVSCFSAHPRIFKLDHLHSNGRSVRPIGPWIHLVPTHLAGKMRPNSASPLCNYSRGSGEGHGTPGFTPDSGSSIRLKASIQKVRMSPGILGSHCWNCLVSQTLHSLIVSLQCRSH
jgi:hypothetical protein